MFMHCLSKSNDNLCAISGGIPSMAFPLLMSLELFEKRFVAGAAEARASSSGYYRGEVLRFSGTL
jgi:hypothetical protein